MKEFLDKISSYNFFNYLFPGVITCLILKQITMFNLVRENVLEGLFVYYFSGLIISRIGSLFIEPILKKMKIIKYADYSEYIEASKNDAKVEMLSEINNMYRTLLSSILVIIICLIWEKVIVGYGLTEKHAIASLIILLFAVLLASYRKQTEYVKRRVTIVLKEKTEKSNN
ncbi:MAG: hypothetical protein L6Q54_12940 [Leptospiraceae bacterium]|nr:hypothetical protein [Leptospiraceae bacterium]